MDNNFDTINENVFNGEENIPLQSFYAELKENGFPVTPLQIIHAQKVIIQYANWVKNEVELCQYLSPIFAGSEEEQHLFKKIFDKHFKREIPKPLSKQQLSVEKKLKQHWKKLVIIYGAIALAVIGVIVYTSLQRKQFDPAKIHLYISNKNETSLKAPLFTKTNTQIELVTICKYDNKSDVLETDVQYNWGDSSITDPLPSHIYITSGVYKLTAYVSVRYRDKIIKKAILHKTVNVCDADNSLAIKILSANHTITIGEKIKCIAITNHQGNNSFIEWSIDNVNVGHRREVDTAFLFAGVHKILCNVFYDSINSACNIYKDTSITVNDKTKPQPVVSNTNPQIKKEDDTIEPLQTPNNFLQTLYKSLAIIFSLLALFFMLLYARQLKKTGAIKSNVLDKYKKLTTSFTTKKAPAILPFKNRNYLPAQQSELDDIAKLLRRRVKDTVTFLNIGKTISKSIEKMGMFTPVQDARTRQSEYLILIDETNTNNQQVKLFEYLVTMLKKQNVLAEVFYFKKHPGFCYNIHEPKGIGLEKLFGKYQRHTLLIMGNGHQLINKTENNFDETFLALLNRWQHKAIVTPVSFLDWQREEKNILLPQIPIVPVDMEGLVLLAEILTPKGNAVDIIARLSRNSGAFYKVKGIDFEQLTVLEQYCNISGWIRQNENGKSINVLLEWVLALSIYPKLRWEITLAIGKSILEKYNLRHQLNFTILLRITRISWMQQGFIKDSLRFEMLKKLSRKNEQTARETILLLLNEIPQQEIESSNSAEEKEVQQIINEFSLYAHDPVFYSSYHESKYMFEKLWQNNQLNDTPTESYFKNQGRQWKTLINQHNNDNETPYNVGVEEYLLSNNREETLLSKVYLALAVISAVVLVSSIAALRVLYIWDNVL